MATSGVLNDFARMPTQRKVLVFVVIGMMIGLVYWQFIYKGLKDDLQQARNNNQSMAAQNAKLAKEIPEYDKLKAKISELEFKIAENQKALPTEAEVPAFFETLERKVTESGVEINKWKKLKEDPVESFVKVPVEIEINGTFMQIKRFFASLVQRGVSPLAPSTRPEGQEEKERIISIENLALTNPTVRNREINLTAKFVAVTFRQDDKSAKDAKKAKEDAAKKAPAPAPAAPASTPAGAQQRTEEAIQKGDEKDRNAAGVEEAKTPAGSGSAAKKLEGGI